MPFNDQNFRQITEPSGRITYINARDIRSFYNFENRLLIEMVDGTNYEVNGAPNVATFYNSTFVLDPIEVTLTDNPLTIDGTIAISSIGGTVTTSTTITNNPLNTAITNIPLRTKEDLTELTLTSSAVNVTTADTLVLPANPNRKFLLLQRGTTVGRTFVKFSAGAATTTNGMLFRENAYFELPQNGSIYTGEIRAIAVGTAKLLYITEGS